MLLRLRFGLASGAFTRPHRSSETRSSRWGQTRGFGFVEMGSQEDADGAIQELNGYTLDGRALTVNEARERSSSGGGRGGFRY